VEDGNHAAFSFPSRTEKNDQASGAKLDLQGEADGVPVPDDAMLSRAKANFIEYVLERMLFGAMQEFVATDTDA
jgi:hypothetical protein